MDTQAQSHRLRTGRQSMANQVYLLTMVTAQRTPVFAGLQTARALIQVLREEQRLNRAQTLAFVVMPDHLHWLMQLGHVVSLAQCVKGVKSVLSKRLGQTLWQPGFHDRAMRSEDDLRAIARYIVANPLRAGLVQQIGDYPHWDACWLHGDGDVV